MTEQPRHPANSTTEPTVETPRRPADTPSKAGPDQWVRRPVASYATYEEAERAVDSLSDRDFPVERVAIIGQDLQTVELVTGKMTYLRAAWRGAVSGAVPGVLIGWLFGLLSWVNPLIASVLLALYGLVIGAVIGAVVGLVVYALQRGRRDFESVTTIRPQRYDVVVDEEVADEAARLLGTAAV
jgi:hypothetical protein